MKVCVKCGFTSFYPEEHFRKVKSTKDGLASICAACDSRRRETKGGGIRKVKGFGYINEGMTFIDGRTPAPKHSWQGSGFKICTGCKERKPADTANFYADVRRGLSSDCKSCQRQAKSARRKTLPVFRNDVSKQCPRCRVIKDFSEYYRCRTQKDGLYCYCKLCHNKSSAEYSQRNREKTRQRENRRKTAEPAYLMKCRLLGLVRKSLDRRALSRPVKSVTSSFWAAVGYSSEDLATHVEKQFLPGMTWANRREWHLDHILPVRSFTYASFECSDFRACWALSNLRPLWALDNLTKGVKQVFLL